MLKIIRLVLVSLAFVVYKNVYCQISLEGKWSIVTGHFAYTVPSCWIYEFSNNQLKVSSFDSLMSTHIVKFDKRLINDTIRNIYNRFDGSGEEDLAEYKILDSITFEEYYFKREEGITKKSFPLKFVKLIPTLIYFPIDSIYDKPYTHWNYDNTLVEKKQFIILNGRDKSKLSDDYSYLTNPKYILDRIDDTLILKNYDNHDHELRSIIPIREVHKDHLVVYGTPGNNNFVKAYKIKTIHINQEYPFDPD